MLNISPHSVTKHPRLQNLKSLNLVMSKKSGKVFSRLLGWLFLVFLIMMFVPWTQNIRSEGQVTTITPDQRPQTIQTIISGRIEKWYVREGDFVEKGDTILFISEVKDTYLDPQLLPRMKEQLASKKQTEQAYAAKVLAQEEQIVALNETADLKIQQARNKVLPEIGHLLDPIWVVEHQHAQTFKTNPVPQLPE